MGRTIQAAAAALGQRLRTAAGVDGVAAASGRRARRAVAGPVHADRVVGAVRQPAGGVALSEAQVI